MNVMSALSTRLRKIEEQIGARENRERCYVVAGGKPGGDVRGFLSGLGYRVTDKDLIIHTAFRAPNADGQRSHYSDDPMKLLRISDQGKQIFQAAA